MTDPLIVYLVPACRLEQSTKGGNAIACTLCLNLVACWYYVRLISSLWCRSHWLRWAVDDEGVICCLHVACGKVCMYSEQRPARPSIKHWSYSKTGNKHGHLGGSKCWVIHTCAKKRLQAVSVRSKIPQVIYHLSTDPMIFKPSLHIRPLHVLWAVGFWPHSSSTFRYKVCVLLSLGAECPYLQKYYGCWLTSYEDVTPPVLFWFVKFTHSEPIGAHTTCYSTKWWFHRSSVCDSSARSCPHSGGGGHFLFLNHS